MVTEIEGKGRDTAVSNSPRPMTWQARLGAVLLGLGFGGAGVYAVLGTTNQAGSAVLVLAGAAFLLIGVQGTRLVRLEGGGGGVELDRAAETIVQVAEREPDDKVAKGMAEAASLLSPSVAQSPAVKALMYADDVHQALERIGSQTFSEVPVKGGGRIDFLVETEGGRKALVEVKAYRRGRFSMDFVKGAIEQASKYADGLSCDVGLLVVTNAPLAESVKEFNAGSTHPEHPVEVIQWNSAEDDHLLARALARVAR